MVLLLLVNLLKLFKIMSKRTALTRYSLIIRKLRIKPSTFQEISDFLKLESELQDDSFTISKRTFQRDIEEIALLYSIEVVYDASLRAYRIVDDYNSQQNERMLEAFDTMSALRISEHISPYVHFETRKSKGTENLHDILHAIRNSHCIRFNYQKFYSDEISQRTLQPYALKEFKYRWYVVGYEEKAGEIKTFGLDRIQNLVIDSKKYTYPKDFSVTEYFTHSFGIIRPNNGIPEKLVLQFSGEEGKYIKSLPLHASQRIIQDTEHALIIELYMYITHDFIQELLQYPTSMQVLEPRSLQQSLQNIYATTKG